MNLYIKKIVLKKNGILAESLLLNDGLSVITATAEMYDVIKAILGEKNPVPTSYDLDFCAEVFIDKTYYINGKKTKRERLWQMEIYSEDSACECSKEYFDLNTVNGEIDSLEFSRGFKIDDYPQRLMKYKDILTYYPDGEFAARTNGYAKTRTFRGFITQYIKHFKPIKLGRFDNRLLNLSCEGRFMICNKKSEEITFLSESEDILYHYLSFISLADFWRRAEKIRNIHAVNKPLVVSDFVERLDESIDLKEILRITNNLKRQVLLLVPIGMETIGYNRYDF